jgi:MerR family copper efflux transcriptional regulator
MAIRHTGSLTIGRVAKQANVTIDTIRFYERQDLLPKPQRTSSGYRLYAPDTVARLNFIRRGKGLGFTLEEIRALLALQDVGGTKANVKELTTRKLQEIESRISDLQRICDLLRQLNSQCSGHGNIGNCPIIETLAFSSLATEIGEAET